MFPYPMSRSKLTAGHENVALINESNDALAQEIVARALLEKKNISFYLSPSESSFANYGTAIENFTLVVFPVKAVFLQNAKMYMQCEQSIRCGRFSVSFASLFPSFKYSVLSALCSSSAARLETRISYMNRPAIEKRNEKTGRQPGDVAV